MAGASETCESCAPRAQHAVSAAHTHLVHALQYGLVIGRDATLRGARAARVSEARHVPRRAQKAPVALAAPSAARAPRAASARCPAGCPSRRHARRSVKKVAPPGAAAPSGPGAGARARHGRPAQHAAAAPGAAAGCGAGGVRAPPGRPAASRLPACAAADAAGRRKNYYDVLQVSKSADDASIKRSYRKLAVKYHPVRRAAAAPEAASPPSCAGAAAATSAPQHSRASCAR